MLSLDGKALSALALLSHVPRALLPLAAHGWAAHMVRRNDADVCDAVPELTKALNCSAGTARRLVLQATAETLISHADVFFLQRASIPRLQRFAARHCSIDGLQHLAAALRKGRGALMFSAHFGNMYLGALTPVAHRELTGVPLHFVMRVRPEMLGLAERLSQVAERPVHLINVDHPMAARDIVIALRRNNCVACMFDFFYEAQHLVIGDFLGDTCATPGGLAHLACSVGTTVLPQFTWRDGRSYHTDIGEALVLPDESLDADSRTVVLTEQMNTTLEQQIRLRPGQWTFWRGLPRRRAWAQAALMEGA
jgi:lauroyl/myristoyl acyltransferase